MNSCTSPTAAFRPIPERATRTLFSGDAIYDGPLLFDLPGSSVEDYARSLRRLSALDVAVVHAGHDPSFGQSRLREIAESYLTRWAQQGIAV